MGARVAEEIADVAQQYELYLHEYVENTRAARVAATAPSHAQWAAIIRYQNALHRQLEHKIRLLDEMQERRKKEEERSLDDYRASLRRNSSGGRRGGRGGPSFTRSPGAASGGPARRPVAAPKAGPKGRRHRQNATRCEGGGAPSFTRPAGPASGGPARQPVAAPKAGSKGRRHHQNATPRRGRGCRRSERCGKAPRGQATQSENRFFSLRPLRPLRLGVNPVFPPRTTPQPKPQLIVRKLERNLDKRGHARNRKKILNRGNELKVLLQTKALAETSPSKRTPFCNEKGAIKAKNLCLLRIPFCLLTCSSVFTLCCLTYDRPRLHVGVWKGALTAAGNRPCRLANRCGPG
jgi:hypothetical protein